MRNRRARFQNKVEVSTGICLVSFFGRAAVTWIAGNLWDVASRRWSDVGILGKNVCSFTTGMMWQLHILLPKMCDLYEHLKCAMCKSVKVRFPQPAEDLLTFSSFFTSSGCNLDMQRLSCERWSVPCATKDAYATKETNNIRNLLQLSATPISLCQHEAGFAPKIQYSQLPARWPWFCWPNVPVPGVQRWPSTGSCCGQNAQETSMKEVPDFVGIRCIRYTLKTRHVQLPLHFMSIHGGTTFIVRSLQALKFASKLATSQATKYLQTLAKQIRPPQTKRTTLMNSQAQARSCLKKPKSLALSRRAHIEVKEGWENETQVMDMSYVPAVQRNECVLNQGPPPKTDHFNFGNWILRLQSIHAYEIVWTCKQYSTNQQAKSLKTS